MKKGLIVIVFTILSLLVYSQENIFLYDDIKGDDNGPGTYTYPENSVFVKGAFDLQRFTMYEEEDKYCFSFEMGTDFKNEWSNKNRYVITFL